MQFEEALRFVRERVTEADQALQRRLGEAQAIAEQGKRYQVEAKEADDLAHLYNAACALLGQYAESRQEAIHERIASLVSDGLTQIFQEDLRLVVHSKAVGRRVDTEFRLVTSFGTHEVETDILSARGGGVAAVTGFLLQVVMVLLTNAPRVLLLDESFAQVSADYEVRLAEFLGELARELDMQIVLVTHSTAYEDASDAVFRVSAQKGKTLVEKVK